MVAFTFVLMHYLHCGHLMDGDRGGASNGPPAPSEGTAKILPLALRPPPLPPPPRVCTTGGKTNATRGGPRDPHRRAATPNFRIGSKA